MSIGFRLPVQKMPIEHEKVSQEWVLKHISNQMLSLLRLQFRVPGSSGLCMRFEEIADSKHYLEWRYLLYLIRGSLPTPYIASILRPAHNEKSDWQYSLVGICWTQRNDTWRCSISLRPWLLKRIFTDTRADPSTGPC